MIARRSNGKELNRKGMAWICSGREQKSPDGAVKAKQGRESRWQKDEKH